MRKRNVLIGGLIAGAFLLPTVASAAVQGVCSNCHTMHATDGNGGTTTPQNTLLTATGCLGCHADNTVSNDASGHGTDGIYNAPQVDNDSAAPAGFILNGGYFDNTNNDANYHNVNGLDTADSILDGVGAVAPGAVAATTVMAINDGTGNPVLTCSSCHGNSGGHHATSATVYRILTGVNGSTSAQTDYGAAAAATATVGTRSENTYNATDMNSFCAGCHGGFHEGTTAGATGGPTTWIRHPTDISVAGTSAGPSIVAYNAAGDSDAVPVGTAGANTDVVMCISCHVPHGGPYANLLSFNLSTVSAGGVTPTADGGCETCHSYAGAGM